MGSSDNDMRFCRERAHAGDPLFRVSVILAPDARRELNALYALFDLVQQTGRQAGEEGAARQRLDWWRQECLVRDPSDSSHPVLRELARAGRTLDRAALARLIDRSEALLETPAISDRDALRAFCELQGRPMLDLELGLSGSDIGDEELAVRVAVQRGIWALLRACFLHGDAAGAWWLPLDLLAREGVRRSEIFAPEHREAARRIIADVLSPEWFPSAEFTDISKQNQIVRHVIVSEFLIRSKLARVRARAPQELLPEMSRVRVGEFVRAWSRARRFNRRK